MKRCGSESTGYESLCNLLERPLQWAGERKLREVNPVSAINTDEEKSGKRRVQARGNSAPLPHMAHSPRILSGSSMSFLAIGRLNPVLCLDAIPQVGQMSPGVGHNNYYYY